MGFVIKKHRGRFDTTKLYLIAKEMKLEEIHYEEVFDSLPEEKQSELIGRKADFAKAAGICL